MDRRLAVATNVFALCELRVLEWRVYTRGAITDASDPEDPRGEPKARRVSAVAADPLGAQARRLQHEDSLCALVPGAEAASGQDELWVFRMNSAGQDEKKSPAADLAAASSGAISVWADGVWAREARPETADECLPLPDDVQRPLFAALQGLATRRLVAQGEFVLDGALFERNDAKFVYRRPSLTRLDCLEVYLDEDVATPAFRLHFRLLLPSSLLTVTVDAGCKELGALGQPRLAGELPSPGSSWERLMGLPAASDPAMVDVWHLDDLLAARIVAETRYRDVAARFRSITRKNRRHGEETDTGNEQDESGKKGDDNDEDAEEDEEDAAHEADGDVADELSRRGLPGALKKKRKRSSVAVLAENDESIVPVSPDTHVNSPDASASTVRMTFPHDVKVELHVAHDVQLFKRKRARSKRQEAGRTPLRVSFGPLATSSTAATNGHERMPMKPVVGTTPLSSTGIGGAKLPLSMVGRHGSFSAAVKSETKPALSVAVSLVESLSHSEQQEALDSRPVRTHPLLQALQDYVDNEAKAALVAETERQKTAKVKFVPNADAFVPLVAHEMCVLSAVSPAATRRLQLNLLADRFQRWRPQYRNLRFPAKKNRRYQTKARQQRLLLEFSETKLEDWAYQRALKHAQQAEKELRAIRDREIAIGTVLAASDALVAWRSPPLEESDSRGATLVPASSADKKVLAAQLQPYLEELSVRLSGAPTKTSSTAAARVDGAWLSLERYLSASEASEPPSDSDAKAASPRALRVRSVAIDFPPPVLSVATAESSCQVAPAAVSEYLLRGLHPVSAPKPVEYALVCPHSPSQWLGSLSLSHLSSVRSMYAQCHMGAMSPLDLSALTGNELASVDAANATVLLECADRAADAFANFRAAGALLRPALAGGADSRPTARPSGGSVVFLVAPFRRRDVRHKLWLLGAFARGLFGWGSPGDAARADAAVRAWSDRVTLELVFLDDLLAAELDPSPHAAMAACFALFDRLGEAVPLAPLAAAATAVNGAAADAAADARRSRVVRERLYHVADWRQQALPRTPRRPPLEPEAGAATVRVHGGYAVSRDGQWLLFACTDALGSVCESRALRLGGSDADPDADADADSGSALAAALACMVAALVDFLALFGERAALVVTRLGAAGEREMPDAERCAWEDVRASRWDALLPARAGASPLVARVLLALLTAPPARELQPLDAERAALVVGARQGLLLPALAADARRAAASRAAPAASAASDPRALRLTVVRDLSLDADDGAEAAAERAVEPILRDFHALSFLSAHPVSGVRQSPLPLHLAAVRAMAAELDALAEQQAADPLARLRASA